MNDEESEIVEKEDEVRWVSVLDLSADEARTFFLKEQSYCRFDLPPYFVFDGILADIDQFLDGKNLRDLTNKPRDHDNLNHVILNNKDGKFAWRPQTLIHPVLYVWIVQRITEPGNWNSLKKRFRKFRRNSKIHCLSIPVEATTDNKDMSEQILKWWLDVEQRSIVLSLEYDYIAQTDIADCYGSIYTHSVAWALHGQNTAKKKRNDRTLLGVELDNLLQDLNYGQTNGIPQGTTLMDFVSEMVLGYADIILSQKLRVAGITEYEILRYRDDYRIFVNHPTTGEEILKHISETMYFLGMKLNPSKTSISGDIINDSIKRDKIEWSKSKQRDRNLQKHVLLIHDFAKSFPNSGSLVRAMNSLHRRFIRWNKVQNPISVIAIIADIARHNPRVYPVAAAIISKLIALLDTEAEQLAAIGKTNQRFASVANTGHLQLWLQRISHFYDDSIDYSERLCQLVNDDTVEVWNNDWISSRDLKAQVKSKKIFNQTKLDALTPVILGDEFDLFEWSSP